MPTGAPYILTPPKWASITHSDHPHDGPLQELVAGWFDIKVSLCHIPGCAVVGSIRSPARSSDHPGSGLKSSLNNHMLYCGLTPLFVHAPPAAVRYGNGCHFTAHLSTLSDFWWYYDGVVSDSGRPTTVSVTGGGDLLTCGENRSEYISVLHN